jgi:hypothetical protein
MYGWTLCVLWIELIFAQSTSAPATQPTDLRGLVGQRVRLEGRFDGPGKLADYVVVPGGHFYLMGKTDTGGRDVGYGSTVAVEGVLQYQEYPPPRQPDGELPQARPPDHFYMMDAKVTILRRASSRRSGMR